MKGRPNPNKYQKLSQVVLPQFTVIVVLVIAIVVVIVVIIHLIIVSLEEVYKNVVAVVAICAKIYSETVVVEIA